MFSEDGWNYKTEPQEGDARKLVTLEQGSMTWVGIRAFNFATRKWMNNNEPMAGENVLAWRDLEEPASGFWYRGSLTFKARP